MAKKISPGSIRYRLVTDFKNANVIPHLKVWVDAIHDNSLNMLPETVESLRNKLLCAVFAFHNQKLVGAGGIMYPPTKPLYYNKKRVVEFRSVFRHPDYKKCGIATELVIKRLEFVKQSKLFPVILTKQPDMKPILKKLGWVYIEKQLVKKLVPVKNGLRDCSCQNNKRIPFIGERCSNCPMLGRFTWINPSFL